MARLRPQVHTEKHIVQFSLASVASGAITILTIADAVAVPSTVTNVREGSTIASVFIEMWVQSDDTTQGSNISTLEKLSGDMSGMAAGESASLNSYSNKKNVFHTRMGLISDQDSYPTNVMSGWYKIPKGKQRFGLSDKLVLNLHGQSNGFTLCGFATYKEQY